MPIRGNWTPKEEQLLKISVLLESSFPVPLQSTLGEAPFFVVKFK